MSLTLYERFRGFTTGRRIGLLFLIVVILSRVFSWRNGKLGTANRTLDGRFTYNVTDVQQLFDAIGPSGRQLYAWTEVTLDVVFPIAYGLFFAMLIVQCWPKAGKWLVWLPLLGAAADYVENFSIATLAWRYPATQLSSGLVTTAMWATRAKWVLGGLSALASIVGFVLYIRAGRRRRNTFLEEKFAVVAADDPDLANLDGVVRDELKHIHAHRHPGEDEALVRRNLVGLALSGGGIRSATTNLGVLQGLSRMGILPLVDYVSTVSGGGYIGACLSSLLSWNGRVARPGLQPTSPFTFEPGEQPAFATDWQRFPFRAEPRRETSRRAGRDIVAHLRTHGNFLIARLGVLRRETLRSIGTLLTGISYHVAVFIVGLFMVSALYMYLVLAVAPHARTVLSDTAAQDERAAASAVASDDRVRRPTLVAVDSTVARAGQLTCVPGTPTCEVRTSFEPPTLWQRIAWNVTVVGRVFQQSWRAWSAAGSRLIVPRPFHPIILALLAGVLVSLGALAWMTYSLRSYVRGEAAKVTRPKRGESEEDTFERHVLVRFGAVLGGMFIVAILVRAAYLKIWDTSLTPREELVWLFAPFALAVGARVSGFIIAVLGQSYLPTWTRRVRSLWGAFQAISIYGMWVTLLFALLPLVIYAVSDHPQGIGLGALGSLIVTRLMTSRTPNGKEGGRFPKIPTGLRNFVLGLAVTLVLLLGLLYFASLVAPRVNGPGAAFVVFFLAAVAFGLLAWSVDPNKLSPHYFYRDRLAETYLLSELPDDRGKIRLYRDAMEMPLSSLHGDLNPADAAKGITWRNSAPYHLISAAINMAGSRDLTRKDRKSGYWLFSKLYCGSTHTGFRKTSAYREGETKVGRAVAISGAAASSAMGRLTFFAQAFATTLFNVRLGHWLENPAFPESANRQETRANWPLYLWREITTDTVETSRLVNLSDGGHTGDNIGVYPLLQRRCKVIIASDAEGDSGLTFGSFTEALRHAYVDMGIDVDIDLTMIRPDRTTGLSRSHCAVGRIRYPDRPNQESWLIYMKNSLTGDEPEPVLNYKAQSPVFPHESTADLFFEDAQFESYRSLGVHIAEHTFSRWVKSPAFAVAKDRHHPTS